MKCSLFSYVSCLVLVGLLFSCSHPQEDNEPFFEAEYPVRINDFTAGYLIDIPLIKLPQGDYHNYILKNYNVDGYVDSNNKKQGFWKIRNLITDFLIQGVFKNDSKNGWWEVYSNRKRVYCGNFKLDKKQGFWGFQDYNCETSKFVNFRNDTLIDLAREYSHDSVLLCEGYYQNGLKDGYWKFYYPEKSIKEQGYFHQGMKNGWWQNFDSDKRLIEEASYSRGEISGYVKRYVNGIISEEGDQFGGRKKGIWKYYNLKGQSIRIQEYD